MTCTLSGPGRSAREATHWWGLLLVKGRQTVWFLKRSFRFSLAAIAVILSAACSSSRAGKDARHDADIGGMPEAGSAGEDDLLIRLIENGERGRGAVSMGDDFGRSIYWTKIVESGPCAFYDASYGECNPECSPPHACGADNVCHVLSREFVDAGTIAVSGLKSSLRLEVVSGGGPNYYYTDYWTPPPGEESQMFDEGDRIAAASEGGAYGPFEVTVTGCADLVTELSCPPLFVDGEPLVVRWTPGTEEDRIRFGLRSGNHATQFSSVVCETDDTGELIVDASIISAYLEQSRPIEMWELIRYRDGTAPAKEAGIILRAENIRSCGWE